LILPRGGRSTFVVGMGPLASGVESEVSRSLQP